MHRKSSWTRYVAPVVIATAVMIGCGDDGGSGGWALDDPDLCVGGDSDDEYALVDSASGLEITHYYSLRFEETGGGWFEVTDEETGVDFLIEGCSENPDDTLGTQPDETDVDDESTTTQAVDTTGDVSTTQASATSTTVRGNVTSSSTPGSTSTVSSSSSTTMAPSGESTTTSYVPQGPLTGNWIRNDSHCSWRGAGSCGVYSGGDGLWEEVGPSGGPGSTFTPIAGPAGQIAYNLYSGNSIQNCDWNGSGQCGWYFTGTPGTYEMGPVG